MTPQERADGGPTGAAQPNLDIWYYVSVLRRRWWLLVTTTVVALGMAWWSQRSELPVYTAEALLQQLPDAAASSPWGYYFGPDMGSHLDIIRSVEVLSPVVDSMGLQLQLQNYKDQRTQVVSRFQADRALRASSSSPAGLQAVLISPQ